MAGGKRIREKKKSTGLGIWAALAGVLILSCLLNTAALDWGQTGSPSWQPDSIGGRLTVIYMPHLFKMWRHKYPRGHFLVNAVFYKPIIKSWEKEPVLVKLPNGKTARTPLDQKRLYQLATVSKRIMVFMSIGILLAVFLTARKLCDDDLAGVLSSLCLALSCLFVFYSQSGCVDIPAFFWFAWAACLGLYAIKSDKLWCYLLAGFCASWSVCTKEGVATFHIGLAVGLGILLVRTKMQAGKPFKKAVLSLVNWKVLAAVALAALVFITLEGLWGGLEEWNYRSQFWKGVVHDEFKSQGVSITGLLLRTYNGLFIGWGGPFMVLLGISLIYWLVRYRWQLCLTAIPVLSFLLLTVLVIGQNIPRFMMCGYAGIAIIMGKALADWYRFRKIPLVIRHVLPLLILVPSFICCVCYNLEMNNDPRARLEQWMKSNAKSGATVGLLMKAQYAPRVWLDGFRSIPQWDSKGVNTRQGKVKIWPDYMIVSDQWPCLSRTDKEFPKKILKDETQYKKRVQFDRLYFNKETRAWKYCLRFYRLHTRMSPRIMIYEK